MEAAFEDLSKAFKEISIVAFTWLKDRHCLVQKQGVKIEMIRKDTRTISRILRITLQRSSVSELVTKCMKIG